MIAFNQPARFLVAHLLEDEAGVVSVCAGCQEQFGVKPPPNASHAYCKRHLLDMYAHSMQNAKDAMGKNPQAASRIKQLLQSIRDIKARPDSSFPPDLAQQDRQQPRQQQQQPQQQQNQHAGVAQ